MTIKILNLKAIEILDSRGNPTVEVEITAKTNYSFKISRKIKAWSQVPSGASTGKFEACELRDEDLKRFNGKGVLKAVNNINSIIAKELKGKNVKTQDEVDDLLIKLDGTENKTKLGANAILAVSMAMARLFAISQDKPLYKYIAEIAGNTELEVPRPFFNGRREKLLWYAESE